MKEHKVELFETNDGDWFKQNINGYLAEGWKIVTANIYSHQFGTTYSVLLEMEDKP